MSDTMLPFNRRKGVPLEMTDDILVSIADHFVSQYAAEDKP